MNALPIKLDARRVEVWRDGAWRASSFPDLAVGEVFRMFDGNVIVIPSHFLVEAIAEEISHFPGRYRVKASPCDDPEIG